MNSDPHESAAWRSFGMLDADQTAGFDEALLHDPELRNAYREMDRLTAAVAVTATVPIAPREGQLERLHMRLGLNADRRTNWLGISGWAAAAALAMILIFDRTTDRRSATMESSASPAANARTAAPRRERDVSAKVEIQPVHSPADGDTPDEGELVTTTAEGDGKAIAKGETKRLIQEIEVLREELANFQARDRQRFEAIPGLAWPVVMRMEPPEQPAIASQELPHEEPGIAAMLGDALRTTTSMSLMSENPHLSSPVLQPFIPPTSLPAPAAVPIYDAARDKGTLVVSNLPATAPNESYHLWVTTGLKGQPIYVGRLPETTAATADSIDFSLGSTAITPSGFVLTKDPQGKPLAPSEGNTVLLGPR